MRKRISIFAGLLALLVGAIAFAAMGTGAYFTDSESGTVSASTAKVAISPDTTKPLTMTFSGLTPLGGAQHKTATIKNDSTSPVDVYLVKHATKGLAGISDQANLSVGYQGFFDKSMDYFAPGAGAAVTPKTVVQPGENLDVTVDVDLQPQASNDWQGKTITIDLDVVANESGAPAPSVPTA